MTYKRYMLISYDHYYPRGGIEDCKGSFDTIEEARAGSSPRPLKEQVDWTEYIFDRIEGVIIKPE